ncbi:hypothetical protein GCM10025869_30320 [Homoserinibacter gongjuensis]|uniref:Uncharacterized protein n=1 Tax=Homoserinibacter gongjuensis TaxID=1162968 RepID=A0ABQ6JW35_9MICO|nr:hypothetical protein GCM10025869_30320 [Homoserinibacter gongjuensis]
MPVQVVAVHRHVERPYLSRAGLESIEVRADALGEHDAPGRDAEEDEIGASVIGFQDLVGHAPEGALNVSLLQHDTCRHPDLLPRLSGRT